MPGRGLSPAAGGVPASQPSQGVHELVPVLLRVLHVPQGQSRQELRPSVGAYVPEAQGAQFPWPLTWRSVELELGWLYLPAGQGLQEPAPDTLYSPAAQVVQELSPDLLYLPAAQGLQELAPDPLYLPGAQW